MEDDGYFDEGIAATYDDDTANSDDPDVVEAQVDFLTALAGGTRALEFGIGTGRIALPLAARGVSMRGIELSKAMAARLAGKPGGAMVDVTIGDFASTTVDERFPLVYLVFNTIMNLTSQAAQVECFRNAAAHLLPGGCFVIEVIVPQLQRLPRGDVLVPFHLSDAHWGIDEYDVVTQSLVSHHLRIRNGRAERFSAPFRYVWAAELDLMARIAGLTLRERWGGWRREPFTSTSTAHVSVWEAPA